MRWPLIIVLAAAGIVELVLRAVIVIILVCTVVGIIALVELDFDAYFHPLCFAMASDLIKEEREGTPHLSRAQRREIEYMRLKNEQLARTNELEREQIQWVDRQLKKGGKV